MQALYHYYYLLCVNEGGEGVGGIVVQLQEVEQQSHFLFQVRDGGWSIRRHKISCTIRGMKRNL